MGILIDRFIVRHPDARSLSNAIGAGLYTASPHCAQPNPWRAFRFYPLPMPVHILAFDFWFFRGEV
jgi:hypothetical protein